MPVPQEIRLAAEFTHLLRNEYLTPDEVEAVRNGRSPTDFLDTNEVMSVAMDNLGIKHEGDPDENVWNDAWAVAVSVRFDPARVGVDARMTTHRLSLVEGTVRVHALTEKARDFVGQQSGLAPHLRGAAKTADFLVSLDVAETMTATAGLTSYASNAIH